jgi:hypothetical protein
LSVVAAVSCCRFAAGPKPLMKPAVAVSRMGHDVETGAAAFCTASESAFQKR